MFAGVNEKRPSGCGHQGLRAAGDRERDLLPEPDRLPMGESAARPKVKRHVKCAYGIVTVGLFLLAVVGVAQLAPGRDWRAWLVVAGADDHDASGRSGSVRRLPDIRVSRSQVRDAQEGVPN